MKTLYQMMFMLVILMNIIACSTTNKNMQLVNAAEKGNTSRVEKLLLAGADINTTNKSGFTPYMAASTNGHLETMQILENAGAKKIAPDPELN